MMMVVVMMVVVVPLMVIHRKQRKLGIIRPRTAAIGLAVVNRYTICIVRVL